MFPKNFELSLKPSFTAFASILVALALPMSARAQLDPDSGGLGYRIVGDPIRCAKPELLSALDLFSRSRDQRSADLVASRAQALGCTVIDGGVIDPSVTMVTREQGMTRIIMLPSGVRVSLSYGFTALGLATGGSNPGI